MKEPNPRFFNGTYTVTDPATAAMTFDELARLYRKLKDYADETAALPTRVKFGSPEHVLGEFELDLAEYELSDNPYVPDGHYVLVRRQRDPLTMLMPTNKPDLVIFSPREGGGYTAAFITSPRPLAPAFRMPADDPRAESDFYALWRMRLDLGRR